MKWGEGSYIQDKGDYCASEGGYCACGGWISYGRGDDWTTRPSTGSSTRCHMFVEKGEGVRQRNSDVMNSILCLEGGIQVKNIK
jgi:hypothetical protein